MIDMSSPEVRHEEAERRKGEYERRKVERERFQPVKIPAEDPRCPPKGPIKHDFYSSVDEGIKPRTRKRAWAAVTLFRGDVLSFDLRGSTDELKALHRALGAKIREVTNE